MIEEPQGSPQLQKREPFFTTVRSLGAKSSTKRYSSSVIILLNSYRPMLRAAIGVPTFSVMFEMINIVT